MQQMEYQSNITNRFGEIIPCPECDGNVRIPFGVSNAAIVRCPRCEHEFNLGDWLEEWVPVLEVVSDEVLDDSDVVLAIDVPKADRTFEPINKVSDVRVAKPRFNSEGSAVNRASSKKRSTSSRRKKRKSNSLRTKKDPKGEMIKMVLGGLLALPVAQLIIWWGLHTDPLKLAPTVDRVFPYILPSSLQAEKNNEEELSEEKKRLLEIANDNSDERFSSLSEQNNKELDDILKNKRNQENGKEDSNESSKQDDGGEDNSSNNSN